MKKLSMVAIVMAVALMLVSCGPSVKMEEAEKIAVEDAGQTMDSVKFTHESQSTENSDTVYEFTFENDENEWEYTLNGNGDILNSKVTTFVEETEAEAEAETVEEVAEAVEEETEEETPVILANPGDDNSPIYDPYNVVGNLGVDQTEYIESVKDTDICDFFDNENNDLYAVYQGLPITNSYVSYMQYWMEKGTYTPFSITYCDAYELDDDNFAKDFKVLYEAMEEGFGEPVKVSTVNSDDSQTEISVDDALSYIDDLKANDASCVYMTFDNDELSISIEGMYDEEYGYNKIFVDYQQK